MVMLLCPIVPYLNKEGALADTGVKCIWSYTPLMLIMMVVVSAIDLHTVIIISAVNIFFVCGRKCLQHNEYNIYMILFCLREAANLIRFSVRHYLRAVSEEACGTSSKSMTDFALARLI